MLVDSVTGLASGSTHVFSLRAIPPNAVVKNLLMHVRGTISRGGGGAATTPEQLSAMIQAITLNVPCEIFADGPTCLLDYYNRTGGARLGVEVDADDVAIDLLIPIVLQRHGVGMKGTRPLGSELKESPLSFTLAVGNIAAANVATLTAVAVDLYAQFEVAPSGYVRDQGGLVLKKIDNFVGNILTIRDPKLIVDAVLIQGSSKNGTPEFTSVSVSSGQYLAPNMTTPSLNFQSAEHFKRDVDILAKLHTVMEALAAYPAVDADGALTEIGKTILFDRRNTKYGPGDGVTFTFTGRWVNNLPYQIVGWRKD